MIPPIHRFQVVDYLANRVRPHVPVEDPIQLATLGQPCQAERIKFQTKKGERKEGSLCERLVLVNVLDRARD